MLWYSLARSKNIILPLYDISLIENLVAQFLISKIEQMPELDPQDILMCIAILPCQRPIVSLSYEDL